LILAPIESENVRRMAPLSQASNQPRMPVLDRSAFRKKLALKVFSSPATLFPIVAGITDFLALWVFGSKSGWWLFAGMAAVLGGLGIFFTRLLLDDTASKKTVEALEQEAGKTRERALDELEQRLAADGDPRTESSLKDLRTLASVFRQGGSWTASLASRSAFDIAQGVEQLFDRCVHCLAKTLELWRIAQKMSGLEARAAILEQRERLIGEVDESIRQLGKILAGIEGIGTGQSSGDSELARLRSELDRSLEVARRVNRRMEDLDLEMHGMSRDEE